jgi:dTDP-4-amino-4,6-dideoxygalactose transaminase
LTIKPSKRKTYLLPAACCLLPAVHIRINIPAWGASELAHGALSFARGGYADALIQELQAFAPEGWRPALLASARYGLALAVEALKVKRVAAPGYVCPAVLTGLRAGGAEVVAVDVAPNSFRFDADKLNAAVRAGRVDAILAANTYGLDQDFAFLNSLGLPVIEDAAYQAGQISNLKSQISNPCGLRGAAGVWSFNFKALTGVGGGVLWIADCGLRIADYKLQPLTSNLHTLFANYAIRAVFREHLPKALGGAAPPTAEGEAEARAVLQEMNAGPMSELQAALALTQWRRRAELAARQQENTRILSAVLAEHSAFAFVQDTEGQTMVHLFPVSCRTPEMVYSLRRKLYERGAQTETPYPVLLGGRDELPNAHDLAARLVLAPCRASLGAKQIGLIGGVLRNYSLNETSV